MLIVDLTKAAQRFLARIPDKHAAQIARKLILMQTNPFPNDSCKLKGYELWRVDVGEYRIIYEATAEKILVEIIGKRNDDAVYKTLKRK